MGNVLSGKLIAQKYKDEIKNFIEHRKKENLSIPYIAAVIIGGDESSTYYIKSQRSLCEKLDIRYKIISLPEDAIYEKVQREIEKLNKDNEVTGIILHLPVPKTLDKNRLISIIDHRKDIDGLTDINCGRLYKNEKCFIPCTPRGIYELIKSSNIDLEGKSAVVVGRSSLVGRPMAELLLRENATVTICHSKTKNLKDVCQHADIIVSAVGKPNLITADFVKNGAVVIDVGTTIVDGKAYGDVDFDNVIKVASFVTPVKGGVGAMTTTMLIKNACEALEKNVY